MVRLMLRTAAIAIALVAAIDPAWSTMRTPPSAVTVVRMTSGDASAAMQGLRAALPGASFAERTVEGGRIPCAPGVPCVLVADSTSGGALSPDLNAAVSLLDLSADRSPDVSITSAVATAAHASSAGVLSVALGRRSGSAIRQSEVRITDGAAIVGSARVEWATADAIVVDVPWWPLAGGARVVRIEVMNGDRVEDLADIGVPVDERKAPVLVFDARPSWSSTFVRRALEDDPRFSVEHRSRIAPALTAGTPRAQLDAEVLEHTSLLVVGGIDALSAADAALIDRYARVRGGSVLLLPEERPQGPAQSLFPGVWKEHLSSTPVAIGPLQAAEVLQGSSLPPATTVLASAGANPVVVSVPRGRGRIAIGGAMDAWRYRDANTSAFDRLWASLALELAERGGPLSIRFGASIASATQRLPFTVARRSFDDTGTGSASVVMRCGDSPATPVRVWPGGEAGEFTGVAPIAAGQACTIDASVMNAQAERSVAVADAPRRPTSAVMDELRQAVAASGGTVVKRGQESTLAATIFAPMPTAATVYPMQAWWWILPFAGTLSAEWWLRRRAGLG